MTELLTATQMRAIEQAAIASGEVTGLELMERAGRGVVEAIFEECPELAKAPQKAVVLCGPGNNGGDGFVVARLLKEQAWEVEVFLYGNPEKLPPDARANYERWGELGATNPLIQSAIAQAPKSRNGSFTILPAFADEYDLVVDALFGGGLNRSLPEELRAFIHSTLGNPGNASKTVAIDAPTGICLDSGKEHNDYDTTVAGLTVTFHRPRVGHYLDSTEGNCGKIRVVDLGLDALYASAKNAKTNENAAFRKAWNAVKPKQVWLANPGNTTQIGKHWLSNKYNHGHALILSGGPGKTGAARLGARGALRIGTGLVTIGCPRTALSEVAAQTTAIMCRLLAGAPGLTELLEDERLNALCLGPGLGLGPDTQVLVLAALKSGRATVLDADALTRFERNPDVLFDALHENCVLTPHAGEFKRLFPDIAEKLDTPATTGPAYSKVDATREAAARAGCTILFKGPDTVIADQTGRCAINSSAYERAAPWLATAGSGDVLAGFITGLLARGFAPMQAAETAAWLHTECALSFGPGLIAEDLPEELPKVFRVLGV